MLYKRGTEEDLKELLNLVKSISNDKDGESAGHLGLMYYNGKGVDRDIDKGIEYMRTALSRNPKWKTDFFNMLAARGSSEDLEEIKVFVESGDSEAREYLVRAYRNMNRNKEDIDEVIIQLETISNVEPRYRTDLYDAMLTRGTTGDFRKMSKLAKDGDSAAILRLSRMYRYGKGTRKNLSKAVEWMRKATDVGEGWLKNELFDLLWEMDTDESNKEMVDIITPLAESGDSNAIGRLGRAYRDGKGVEKNIDASADWFKKITDKYPQWVTEAADIFLRTENPELWGYAFDRCLEISDDYPIAIVHIAHMYRDGKGTDKNLDKAIEWMKKVAENNPVWNKELSEMIKKI